MFNSNLPTLRNTSSSGSEHAQFILYVDVQLCKDGAAPPLTESPVSAGAGSGAGLTVDRSVLVRELPLLVYTVIIQGVYSAVSQALGSLLHFIWNFSVL